MTDCGPLTTPSAFVPEILAPAGGKEQFLAALNAGADAVFLGLKNFNARSRAQNFTLDELRDLTPVAHRYGMKVLVTMNILIKNCELSDLIDTLSALEDIGIDAIIVQDIGLAKLCREYFPHLKMHASTQLAVHNLDGVLAAMQLGFKRVVLARELTAIEIKRIRAALPHNSVELEAFCHGSLCYSYSGLCFFSGAEDARSGNRGECAYTCRKPYKILNEPGHGFLFSMKDLNTVESLELLVDAGVNTLKIEGRKKDAQYVVSAVQAYRQKLDAIFKRKTLRSEAPQIAHELTDNPHSFLSTEQQLKLGFHRNSTAFFLKGRYHENVIDLDNATHTGQFVGHVAGVSGRFIEIKTECPLELHDGLRIDPATKLYHATPQHGQDSSTSVDQIVAKYHNEVCHFALRNLRIDGHKAHVAEAADRVEIEIPEGTSMPRTGDLVYRTRADAMRRHTERLSRLPADNRLRPLRSVQLKFSFSAAEGTLRIDAAAEKFGRTLFTAYITTPAIRPANTQSDLSADMESLFSLFGNINFAATNISLIGDTQWFVQKSKLKELKRVLETNLPAAHQSLLEEREAAAREQIATKNTLRTFVQTTGQHMSDSMLTVKIDRLEYLPSIREALRSQDALGSSLRLTEVVFEPKRAFLGQAKFSDVVAQLVAFKQDTGLNLRLALPTVLRAWDEPMMKRWVEEFVKAGVTAVEVGNVGHFAMLERWRVRDNISSLSSDFTLYALNQQAASQLADWGVETISLSVEDDFKNMRAVVEAFPPGSTAQAILYKDTPLFIAESCSLTALHNGCPTNTVCGYRTLEIQNDEGEVFYVAHESCKSIVYRKEPFSLTQQRSQLEEAGFRSFRVDFLTRPYEAGKITEILNSVYTGNVCEQTHTANFFRTLL